MQIEDVRSDLRFMIDNGFRKYKITIPFPQQDLYVKTFPSSPVQAEDHQVNNK
jgi:small-conductance mechanosensitive channel